MDLVNAGFRSSENSSTVWWSNLYRNCAWDIRVTAERKRARVDPKKKRFACFTIAIGRFVNELVNALLFSCINLKEERLLLQIKE